MHYSKELTILAVGLQSGGIITYRIKTERDYKEYETFSFINPHNGPIVGIIIDYSNSNLFSCGSDKRIVKTNLMHETVLSEYFLDFSPVFFIGNMPRQKLYALNKKTGILVLDSESFVPCMSISISEMCCLGVSSNEILFLGSFIGNVYVYRESVAINSFMLKSKVLCICYSYDRKEVFIGNLAGFVSVWNRKGKLMSI